MVRWAGGGIILSSVVTRYQLGLARQAGSVIVPPSASTPQGTCESAMNAARSAGRSPANAAGNLSRSKNKKPSLGGRIGGPGTSVGNPARRVLTDCSAWPVAVGQADSLNLSAHQARLARSPTVRSTAPHEPPLRAAPPID